MSSLDRLLTLDALSVWSVSGGEYAVAYEKAEIKMDGVLISAYGIGNTFYEACDDYMRKISGRTLVFNAATDYRKEVHVL